MDKTTRKLKITELANGAYYKDRRPSLKLQGKWLEKFFQIGEYVNVECDHENNRIIITKIPSAN